jgi:carbon-monoxide dehydrogenase medium subunit
MKPARFDYHAPTTIAHAVALLDELGEAAKPLAGGQSLIPMLNLRLARFEALVDLGDVEGLDGIERLDGQLAVGAMVRQSTIERSELVASTVPLLAVASPLVGHFQIRNRGTIGGSLAHADPAAEYPAVALALEAEADVMSASGRRTVPAAELFAGTWETALAPEELLVAVRFPVWSGSTGFAVEEVARRHGDFAIAGCACGVELREGVIARAAVALFGVASTPVRAVAVERALIGGDAEPIDATDLGRLAAEGLQPPDDLHSSSALRCRMAGIVTARALSRAIEDAHHA